MGNPGYSHEVTLEHLLRDLLDAETTRGRNLPTRTDLSSELLGLLDMARRLRAAGQRMPRPGVSTAPGSSRTSWPVWRRRGASDRSRIWRRLWGGAAAAALLGTLSLINAAGSSSGLWYGARLALEDLRVALVPSPLVRAEMLIKSTHVRIAEIQALADSGDFRGLRLAASALEEH